MKGSGWTSALVQADVTTPGRADSFLKVSHITSTRRVRERLTERKVSVDEVLSRNKLALSTRKHLSEKKGKQQLMLMKSDMHLF